jgi:hypothetical protein
MEPKLNNQDRDLLEFVATAQRVTHNQLLEVALLKDIASDRKSFEWRISRLAESGLVRKQRPAFLNRRILYTSTRAGVLALENLGVHMLSLYAEPDDSRTNHQVMHSLESNRIHIALIKSKTLLNWKPGHGIRILHRFDKSRYPKIYDAIATLIIEKEIYEIGLEYERSLKPAKKYLEIQARLSNRDNVDAVVYVCPSTEILQSVREIFSGYLKKPVLVAKHEEFIAGPLNAMLDWSYRETTLHGALLEIRERSASAASDRAR